MTWNYRLVCGLDGDPDRFGICEVYYEDDRPTSRTETPEIEIGAGDEKEAREHLTLILKMMMRALDRDALPDSFGGGTE